MVSGKDVFIPQHLYGIIGQPLGHSLSPLVHNHGFQALGLAAVYFRWILAAECLADFICAARALPISGFSVTIPHKQAILPFLDGCTAMAMKAGAVNTVFWEDAQLWGENTDIHGFLSPLPNDEWRSMRDVLVLGNGGAARAVLVGLTTVGAGTVTISGRDRLRCATLAEEFGVGCLDWDNRGDWRGDLLVNTTPLGMAGKYRGLSPWPDVSLRGVKKVYDLVYNPLETQLILQGKTEGVPFISGLEMFLGQADAQFALWTQRALPVAQLRGLVTAHLA